MSTKRALHKIVCVKDDGEGWWGSIQANSRAECWISETLERRKGTDTHWQSKCLNGKVPQRKIWSRQRPFICRKTSHITAGFHQPALTVPFKHLLKSNPWCSEWCHWNQVDVVLQREQLSASASTEEQAGCQLLRTLWIRSLFHISSLGGHSVGPYKEVLENWIL